MGEEVDPAAPTELGAAVDETQSVQAWALDDDQDEPNDHTASWGRVAAICGAFIIAGVAAAGGLVVWDRSRPAAAPHRPATRRPRHRHHQGPRPLAQSQHRRHRALDLAHKGRHPLYDAINTLVGITQQGGTLVHAINPVEKHAAGPCPTIVGRARDGKPRQCGQMLFADTYDRTTTCPNCGHTVDVEQNRRQAAADRDLHTRDGIAEVLDSIDEHVTDTQLDAWIKARRLRPQGWTHDGSIVQFRIGDGDEPVYSIERARKLRRRDANLRSRQRRRLPA